MSIKTAIIGYGRSGSTLHADPIEKLPDFELTAVCDIEPAAREKAQKRFGCRTYEDYTEMLAKEDIDLAVIVTRSYQHSKMACDCLKAGKNTLVTKPWALNKFEAMNMIAAARESKKLLLPWLPARWGCDLLKLKEIVDSGTIGRVFQIRRSEFIFGIRHDWQTESKYGGGYLLNWGPHLVDQPLQLIGQPVVKSVYGELKQIINPGDTEDVFYAVMRTADDITVVSEFNIGSNMLPNWVVQGDRGTVYVKDTEIEIHKATFPEVKDNSTYSIPANIEVQNVNSAGNGIVSNDRYGNPMVIYSHIAKSIRGEEYYQVTPESALRLTVLLDSIRKSNEYGQVIKLTD